MLMAVARQSCNVLFHQGLGTIPISCMGLRYPQVGSHHFAVITGQRVHDAACMLALPTASAAHFRLSAGEFMHIMVCCSRTAYTLIPHTRCLCLH